MKKLVAFFLLCIILVNAKRVSTSNSLSDIADRIKQEQSINQWTVGDNSTWSYLESGLTAQGTQQNTINFQQLDVQITDKNNRTELLVQGSASVWGQDLVDITVIFYYDSTNTLDFYMEFDLDMSSVPGSLIPSSSSSWYSGINLTGKNSASICSASFTDNNGKSYKKGLTINANVQLNDQFPAKNTLAQLMGVSDDTSIDATIVAVFPLTTGEPLAQFSLEFTSPIYFGGSSNVYTSNLQLNLQVSPTNPSVTLTTTLYVKNLGSSSSTLKFNINAQLSSSTGFTFSGNMMGTWSNAFGLTWLSIQNLQISFQYDSSSTGSIDKLNFQGGLLFTFSPSTSVTASWSASVSNNVEQVELTVSLPISDFGSLFDQVVGQRPSSVDEISANGQIQVVISTYSFGSYKPGLTLSGNVKVSSNGQIFQAVKSVNPSASLSFTMNLYIPVFSQTPEDIDFSLTESGQVEFTPTIRLDSFSVDFALTPVDQIQLSATLEIDSLTSNSNSLTFAVSASIQGTEVTKFQGNLKGSWNNPFGLTWLSLQNVQISCSISAGEIQSISISGQIGVKTTVTSTTITVNLQSPLFKDWSFSVYLLVPNAYDFLQTVTGTNPPQKVSEIAMATTLTLSSFGSNAGLTLSGDAWVTPKSNLANDILALDPSNSLNFALNLYIPIFSQNPEDISFTLSEKGNFPLTGQITLENFQLQIEITPTPKITISSTAQVTLQENSLTFSVAADLDGDSQFSLSGNLQGSWNQPFGFSWLEISSFTVSLSFANGKLGQISFEGQAKFTFGQSSSTGSVTFQTNSDLSGVMFEIKDVTILSYANVISSVSSLTPPDDVHDIQSVTNSVDIVFATYSGQGFSQGLTISDQVSVTGTLLNKLAVFDRNGQISSAFLKLGLTIPIFDNQTPDIKIFLQTSEIPLKENLALTGVKFQLDTTPVSFTVSTGLLVNFSNNPQLEFDVSGSFSTDGSIQVSGDMEGTWVNMFGIKGFDLANVALTVGFDPALCSVDFCLSALGLGYDLTLGTKEIQFYGYAAIPEIEKLFLEGKVGGADDMALSFRDIAMEWNDLIGNRLHIPLDINSIPADWGFQNSSFYIAPESGTFDNVYYSAGFKIDTGFDIIGIVCDVDIAVTSTDFAFDVHISLEEFSEWLHKELVTMVLNDPNLPSWNHDMRVMYLKAYYTNNMQQLQHIVNVHNVTMTQLSTANLATGVDPQFYMQYSFLGEHDFNVRLPILELYNGFHHFYLKYLADLFK